MQDLTLINRVLNGTISVFAIKSIYSKSAILKCLYWYGDKFNVTVTETDKVFCIALTIKKDLSIEDIDLELYLQKLERDIIDFNLRDIVINETRNIRDLLVAKAFSNGEFEETPMGEIADPVGFDV